MAKLILHLGPGKTGTSSLQNALYANRHALLREGIFYPVFPGPIKEQSHHILQPLCKPEADMDQTWIHGRHDMELIGHAAHLYYHMLTEMRELNVHTVILSSEILWVGTYFPFFARMLRRDFAEINPVIYVRNPKDHYRSILQQKAKAGLFGHSFVPISPYICRTEEAIGTGLTLLPYWESSTHPHWNIVDDFWVKVLECAPPQSAGQTRANKADSVELTLILLLVSHFYRQENAHREIEREVFERISYLRNGILGLDQARWASSETRKFVINDIVEHRIAAVSHADWDWVGRRMNNELSVTEELPDASNGERVFADVDELFCSTKKNLAVCMAMVEGAISWFDSVIAAGDSSHRAKNLKRALHAAEYYLKAFDK